MDAVPVHLGRTYLPEGVRWDPSSDAVYWVDILAGEVRRHTATSDSVVLELGETIGCIAPARSGWIVCGAQTIYRHPLDGSAAVPIPVCQLGNLDADIRCNDGEVSPHGSLVFGTMARDPRTGAGSLYEWLPDRGLLTLLRGVTISNGLAWDRRGGTLWYIDTPTQQVTEYHHPHPGTLRPTGRRVAVEPELGSPDGMCRDDQGRLWIALWGGSAVGCWEDGRLVDLVRVPAPFVTRCALDDRGDLWITAVADEPTDLPSIGGLYRAHVGAYPDPGQRTWRVDAA